MKKHLYAAEWRGKAMQFALLAIVVVFTASVAQAAPWYDSTFGSSDWISVGVHPAGNVSITYKEPSGFSDYFASVTGGTVFTSNGNGTYNTVTYPTESSSGGGAESLSSTGDGNIASDCAYYGGVLVYPNGYPMCVSPGDSKPFNDTGYYEKQCTSSGKGQSCVPVWVPITSQTPPQQQSPVQQPSAPSVPPVVTISASPSIVRLGGSSRVTWNGGAADECTVSGPGLSSSAISSSQVVNNIEGQSTYRITCSRGTAVAEDTTRVDIVPIWREF